MMLLFLVAYHPSLLGVSQGKICKDKFMCCHSEIEVADNNNHNDNKVADQTSYLRFNLLSHTVGTESS